MQGLYFRICSKKFRHRFKKNVMQT